MLYFKSVLLPRVSQSLLLMIVLGGYLAGPQNEVRANLQEDHNYVDLAQKVAQPCANNTESHVVALIQVTANPRVERKVRVTAPTSLMKAIADNTNTASQTYEFIGKGCNGNAYRFAIRSIENGLYVRAGIGAQSGTGAQSTSIDNWEEFQLTRHQAIANAFAIKSSQSGKYLHLSATGFVEASAVLVGAAGFATEFADWKNNFDRPWAVNNTTYVKKIEGQHPLMVVTTEWQDQPISDHRNNCTQEPDQTLPQIRRMVFGPQPSIKQWYEANSQGKFTFSDAGVWGGKFLPNGSQVACQDNDPNCDFMRSGQTKLPLEGYTARLNALFQGTMALIDDQVDFRQYDKNHDGVVTSDELTIMHYLTHDGCGVNRGGFGARWNRYVTKDGVVIAESAADQKYKSAYVFVGARMWTMSHELIHATAGGLDMYGEMSTSPPPHAFLQTTYGGDATLPASWFRDTGGYASNMASGCGTSVNLDPVMKLKLGWLEPKLAYRSGWYSIKSASTSPEALIVHNPQKGASDYFILEYRKGAPATIGNSYDSGSDPIAGFPLGTGTGQKKIGELTKSRGIQEEGLAIWRMSESYHQTNFTAQKMKDLDPRYAIQLMPSSGQFSCIQTGATAKSVPLTNAAGNTVFTLTNLPFGRPIRGTLLFDPSPGELEVSDNTAPLALRWSDNTPTGIRISRIHYEGDEMKMYVEIKPLANAGAAGAYQNYTMPWSGAKTSFPPHPALICP